MPFVVKLTDLIPFRFTAYLTSSLISFLNKGSPPVNLIFETPNCSEILISFFISFVDSNSFLFLRGRPSSGIQ